LPAKPSGLTLIAEALNRHLNQAQALKMLVLTQRPMVSIMVPSVCHHSASGLRRSIRLKVA
jgi:hypothetical protein